MPVEFLDEYGVRHQICQVCGHLMLAPLPVHRPVCAYCTAKAKEKEIGHLLVLEPASWHGKYPYARRGLRRVEGLTKRQRAYMAGREPDRERAARLRRAGRASARTNRRVED